MERAYHLHLPKHSPTSKFPGVSAFQSYGSFLSVWYLHTRDRIEGKSKILKCFEDAGVLETFKLF